VGLCPEPRGDRAHPYGPETGGPVENSPLLARKPPRLKGDVSERWRDLFIWLGGIYNTINNTVLLFSRTGRWEVATEDPVMRGRSGAAPRAEGGGAIWEGQENFLTRKEAGSLE